MGLLYIKHCQITGRSSKKRASKSSVSHDKLSTMRFLLKNLKVLVIDEISMVGLPMLEDINERLQLIVCTPNTTCMEESVFLLLQTLTEKLSHCEYLANMLRIICELLCSQ